MTAVPSSSGPDPEALSGSRRALLGLLAALHTAVAAVPSVASADALNAYWSESRGDHLDTATAAGAADAQQNGYRLLRCEALIFPTQLAGTVPLQQYWNADRNDSAAVATGEGTRQLVADGYTLVRTEGYVFPTSQPGTQPLVVLRHGERGDTLLAATSTSLGEARSAGYEVVRTEGYVFPCDMKVPLTLTTGRGGSLAGAGRTCAGSATACTLSVAVATPVTVTATSDDGFVLWSWGGGCAGQDNPCTLTPAGPGPVAISADFARVGTVSVEPGEGAPGGRWPRLCLEDTGHGFVLTRCRAAAAQTWVFSPGGLLVAPRSHLCLADLGGSTAANVPSNSAPYGCLANPAAEFSFEPMLKQFRNKGTGLCLRVGVAERSAAFWVLISGGCLSDQVWSFTAGHL